MRELTWLETNSVAGGYKSIQTIMNDYYQQLVDDYYIDYGGSVGYQWAPGIYQSFFSPAEYFSQQTVVLHENNLYVTSYSSTGSDLWYDINGDGGADINFIVTSQGFVMGDYNGDGYFESYMGNQNE